MHPTSFTNSNPILEQRVYAPVDERLEELCLIESANHTLDLAENIIAKTQERIRKFDVDQSNRVRKTLRLGSIFLFSVACLGFTIGLSKDPVIASAISGRLAGLMLRIVQIFFSSVSFISCLSHA